MVPQMFALKSLLGGILAVTLATSALAQPVADFSDRPTDWPIGGPQTDTRPLSRFDAEQQRAQAAQAALRAHRPNPRPVHMIRYPVVISQNPSVRPRMRVNYIPDARWDFRGDSASWTRAALAALRSHGERLDDTVPRDIETWCPGYAQNPPHLRRAFWVGMMSALAKHESTYRPTAVGGGNLWYGLLQIYPDTARRYGCRATTGEALKDPEDNLSCAIRIMNVTVPRDNAIALRDTRWRGVAADWGPMTHRSKIAEMAAWTRQQEYCQVPVPQQSIRPRARPIVQAALSTMDVN
ncbi:transglycosylase [Thalassorhabdomicrobium marinisediminis]|uniref:Transglycosylase n=2 Tax=Thalassorhabdomicrobium marinisediminis TaxID=2170577 RepID=A0A2T7FY28_9RHOB|nr:transglycosylase [Thalassorhabdomicrobium marinisediminis]